MRKQKVLRNTIVSNLKETPTTYFKIKNGEIRVNVMNGNLEAIEIFKRRKNGEKEQVYAYFH